MKFKIYTDGACSGNPGPGGWGAVIFDKDNNQTNISGKEKNTTNNRMELMAAIKALEALSKPCKVRVTTDSVYVKNGITDWIDNWKKRNWRTANKKAVKNVDLWQQLDEVSALHKIEWCWVKGHSGHIENERADQLANTAIDNMLDSD